MFQQPKTFLGKSILNRINFIKSIPNVLHVGQSTHHFSPDMVGRKKQTQDKNFFIC